MATRSAAYRLARGGAARRVGADAGEILRRLDYLLLAAVAGVAAYGLWVLNAVTHDDVPGSPDYYLTRQAIYVAVGALLLAGATAVAPDVYRRYRTPLLLAVIALMVLVFVAGPSVRGSRRWIDLGFFRLQPSEIGKVVLVLFVAGFLAERARRVDRPGAVLAALAVAAAPTLLVFFQPDFGTALVYCAAFAGVLYFAGARWLHLGGLAAAAATVGLGVVWFLPAAGIQLLKPYQVERLVGFIHPDSDPTGSTYNLNQAITAVGSGGLDGRGVAGATQTNLDYLPEHATDFIFASLAEQRGFLGVSILLLLYALIVWRGIRIVAVAESLFAAAVAGAIVIALLFQVFLNIGMNVGIAPITGIPLPFVSYGGSSMLTSFVMIGILQSINARGRLAARR